MKLIKKKAKIVSSSIKDWIEENVVSKDLWRIRNHDSPEIEPVYIPELVCDYSESQIPADDYWS